MSKETVFIPCEPFEGVVFSTKEGAMIKAMITGYHVAIREIATFPATSLLMPIDIESGARHGVIAAPVIEPLQVSAGPA